MATRSAPVFTFRQRDLVNSILITGIAVFVLATFIAPLGYMFTTALKSTEQMGDSGAPWYWPFSRKTIEYQGKDLELLQVPLEDGLRELAILKKTTTQTTFVDPQNLDAEPIVWQGNWRKLSPVYVSDPQWQNFKKAWDDLNFPLLFRNSMLIAGFGTFGAVLSAIFVSYGFARFNFRGKNLLFLILIATIILPVQATL
ncbi:MAG: carbohydrate ABC transporter permease, partial [Chloroflexi bacterium]